MDANTVMLCSEDIGEPERRLLHFHIWDGSKQIFSSYNRQECIDWAKEQKYKVIDERNGLEL